MGLGEGRGGSVVTLAISSSGAEEGLPFGVEVWFRAEVGEGREGSAGGAVGRAGVFAIGVGVWD